MSQQPQDFSKFVCCAKGCTAPAVDVLYNKASTAVGYPICREHSDKRKWELALLGNATLEIDRHKLLTRRGA